MRFENIYINKERKLKFDKDNNIQNSDYWAEIFKKQNSTVNEIIHQKVMQKI